MKKWHYYNDNDPYICQWVRNLVAAGLVPDGEVDERPIQEVLPEDVKGFRQAHFFCGILGWPLALQLAGWPEDRPVWTGSCPCQPFSVAGKGAGTADARHLWPTWFGLIKKCGPTVVFGEQTPGPLGREWFAGVRADLETVGYAFGAADLCAASVGAPHPRQRLWWVAYADGKRRLRGRLRKLGAGEPGSTRSSCARRSCWDEVLWIADAHGHLRRFPGGFEQMANGVSRPVEQLRAYGNSIVPQVAAVFIEAADLRLEGK